MSSSSTTNNAEPSQVNGQISQAKAVVYETIGAVSSDPSWKEEGAEMRQAGEEEVQQAREKAKVEAGGERLWGKAESAYGMLVGDQEKLNEGNLKAEKGEWKAAAADGKLPSVSTERLQGKAESAFGMLTGDTRMQQDGNIKAEKAEWLHG